MLIRIALVVYLYVLEPVFGLRDGEALRSSLAADPNGKNSDTVTSQEMQDQDSNGLSFAQLKEAVFNGKHGVFPWTDACHAERKKLEEVLTKFCSEHGGETAMAPNCEIGAMNVVDYGSEEPWASSLVTSRLGAKVPVFWAGFSEFDTSGMASKTNLSDFVKNVNGLLLHGGGLVEQTEWGTAVEEANELKSCSEWTDKKPFWMAASSAMAVAMHRAKKNRVVIAARKELAGDRSLFKSILYREELLNLGVQMRQHPEWNPSFEVYEIPIPVAKSSECTVAPWLKKRLEDYAQREVTMTCALCPQGLRDCRSEREVTAAEMTYNCKAGDCVNGKGFAILADGDRYKGYFKNGLPEGKGKLMSADGNYYDGDFEKGLKDGQGKYETAVGDRYEGDYKKGEMDGEGTYVWKKGDRYEGQFKSGLKHGKGKLLVNGGAISYEGDFQKGQIHGQTKLCIMFQGCVLCKFEMGRRDSCAKIP